MKTKAIWLSSLACNGNSHALLTHPRLSSLLDEIEFLYHPLLPSTNSLSEILEKEFECDILLIEGTIDPELRKSGVKIVDLIRDIAKRAKWVVTVGTCSTFGGIFAQADDRLGGLHFKGEEKCEKFSEIWEKTVSLPGCPVHPEILVKSLQMIANGISTPLDNSRRPKLFFGWTVHDGCSRNEYFEYKEEGHEFGQMEGCMFIEHGCRAPFTRGSCNKILWNQTNSKTRAGQPCMGCTEPDFPADGLWRTKKHMGIPAKLPLDIPKRAYLTLAGIAKAFRIERFEKRILDEEES